MSFNQKPGLSYAHGGGHEEVKPAVDNMTPAQEPTTVMEAEISGEALQGSIYEETSEETAPQELGEYDLGESDLPPLNSDTNHLADDIPTMDSHAGMDMSADGENHKMNKIELASSEWVSPSRKGYSAAMGITLLAGLAFGFLTLKRPFE